MELKQGTGARRIPAPVISGGNQRRQLPSRQRSQGFGLGQLGDLRCAVPHLTISLDESYSSLFLFQN